MIRIKIFTFNLFSENTIILWDDNTLDCALIDPGCSDLDEEKELEDFLTQSNLNVKYLINTHCHIDHILGCEFVKRKYDPVYLAPEMDLPLLEIASEQAGMFGIDFSFSLKPDKYLSEETRLFIGDSAIEFLYTPGHTSGEYCIFLPDVKWCITGDVLFEGSIGRTDLWGGDYDTLLESINEKLMKLPDETKIFPGHGGSSTIGKEKNNNPFLNHIV